jgi:hypothetical protein
MGESLKTHTSPYSDVNWQGVVKLKHLIETAQSDSLYKGNLLFQLTVDSLEASEVRYTHILTVL